MPASLSYRQATPLEIERYERGQQAEAELPKLAADTYPVLRRVMESGILMNDDAAELSMLVDCIADLPEHWRDR